MTAGAPAKVLIRFSLPMLLSAMFQQLYNLADSVVAGQGVSKQALAAVGASYPITMIFMAVAMGLSIGCTVVISRYFGAGDIAQMKTAVYTSLFASVAIGALLLVAGLICCRGMLALLQTDASMWDDAVTYLNIYFLSLVFVFLYNSCLGVFTALGDSRTPLYLLIASSLGNIALDVVFVFVCHWGVAGVAWATLLCQGVCSLAALWVLLRRIRRMPAGQPFPLYSGRMLLNIGRIAVPSILQQSFISVGNLFIQGLVNSFGVDVTAGYAGAIKLNTFAITTFSTIGNSVSSFTAQNAGARKPERIRQGFRVALLLILVAVLPFTLLYLTEGTRLLNLFLDAAQQDNAGAIATGGDFLRLVAPFYLLVAVKLVADGVLRGMGAMKEFMIATFTDLILRVVLAFVLSDFMGSSGIWLSWSVGWAIAVGLSLWFYRKVTRTPALSNTA